MRNANATTLLLTFGAAALFAFAMGCGEEEESVPPTNNDVDAGTTIDAGSDAASGPQITVLHPNALPLPGQSECTVTITTGLEITSAAHVTTCTPVTYATNPPSSGEHWPIWASFGIYDQPVPREMYVHDLEHGALVLAYRCDSACPEITDALGQSFADAVDSYCLTQLPGTINRLILTPDPALDTPIAAAAWGATYTATCIDKSSLDEFIAMHIGRGPEAVCADGQAPAPVVASCTP